MHTSPARSTPFKWSPFPISPSQNFEAKTTSVMIPPTTMSVPKPTTRTMMVLGECNYVRSRLLMLWWIPDKLFKITLIVFCLYSQVATSQQRSNNKVVYGRRTSSAPSAGSRSASQKSLAPSPSPSPTPSPVPSPSVALRRLPLSVVKNDEVCTLKCLPIFGTTMDQWWILRYNWYITNITDL